MQGDLHVENKNGKKNTIHSKHCKESDMFVSHCQIEDIELSKN